VIEIGEDGSTVVHNRPVAAALERRRAGSGFLESSLRPRFDVTSVSSGHPEPLSSFQPLSFSTRTSTPLERTHSVSPVEFVNEEPPRQPRAAAPRAPRRAPPDIARSLQGAAAEVRLSPTLLEAVAWAESRFNQQAVSRRGARGVMQLMPGTAADLGVDANDLDANIKGGARYLKRMLELFDGDLELALAAYNAGPNAVRRHNGVPPYAETRAYVARVMNYLAAHT
jgi:hypothetical protein